MKRKREKDDSIIKEMEVWTQSKAHMELDKAARKEIWRGTEH